MAANNIKKPKKVKTLFEDDEDEYLDEDNYFKIDGKNTFSIGDANDSKESLYSILEDNDEYMQENNELHKKLISIFYDKIYKFDSDPFRICHDISKQLKSLNIQSTGVEEKLKYFINKKNNSKNYCIFKFNQENINNLGYVLAYTYRKFSNEKELKTVIERIKGEKLDELIFIYYNMYKSANQKESSVMSFLKAKFKDHKIPGPFAFLMNAFLNINTIDINFNFEEETLNRVNINLFILSLLNIPYIFPSKITIKINLINEEFQCSLYRRFNKELYERSQDHFKMIYINKADSYKEKWDFETEFLLEKYRQNRQNDIETISYKEISSEHSNDLTHNKDDSNIINKCFINLNINVNNSNIRNSVIPKIKKTTNNNNKNNIGNNSYLFSTLDDSNEIINESNHKSYKFFKNYFSSKALHSNKNSTSKMTNNPNDNKEIMIYENIIEKHKKSIGLMLITIDSLSNLHNMKKLNLIINDVYKGEYKFYFKNYCSYETNDKFHIMDILINKVNRLEELNIEINILDYISFQKVLSFINNNKSMEFIKLSFFSSDATYLRQSIYKIYFQNIGEKEVSISKIINLLFPYFVKNLEVLFELIKIKDYKKIEVNFDIPDIIEINNSYMNTIFKFLMNLLFLVDNKKSLIRKFVILAPKIKFDQRYLPSIENILEDINFNENNKVLTELSIHLQFFMIKNIKNLISENLVILNIGDCDIYTFRELTKFLTSYKFSRKSELQKISISLLNSIIKYTSEIKTIFYKLFSINIKQLIELNLYTNIYIFKDEYNDIVNILKYNYIPKYRLIFNPKNDLEVIYYKEEIMNNISYLVLQHLEDDLSINDESVRNKKKKNKNKKDKDIDDNLYWVINQIVNKKIKKNELFLKNRKKIIFNILQYLYLTKNVEIIHQFESNK